jgi:hypothetical protein
LWLGEFSMLNAINYATFRGHDKFLVTVGRNVKIGFTLTFYKTARQNPKIFFVIGQQIQIPYDKLKIFGRTDVYPKSLKFREK